MNSHSKIHQARLEEWSAHFADQAASGLTVREWCSQSNISFHKYNYWKHQLKEQLTDKVLPDIVPIMLPETPQGTSRELHESCDSHKLCCLPTKIPSNSSISISIDNIKIEISSADVFLLPDIIKAVRYA